MTVKSGASRVGHLYAVWSLPRGGGDFSMKKKNGILVQANLDMSHALFVPWSWSAPSSGFTSPLFDVQPNQKKIFLSKTRKQSDLLLSGRDRSPFYIYCINLILAMRFQSMESDLTVIQNFLDQCHNRRFISFPVYQEPFK